LDISAVPFRRERGATNETHPSGRTQPNFLQSRLLVVPVLVALLAVPPCMAQPAETGPVSTRATADTSAAASSAPSTPTALRALSANAVGAWVGGSFASGGPIGNIPEVHMGMMGLRYHRLLTPSAPEARGGVTLTYTIDVFPLLFLRIPPNTVSLPPDGGELGGPSEAPIQKRGFRTYGFGASPAGLRLTARVAHRVQPFIAGSTGLAYFVQSMPNGWGRHLNFLFEVGGGVQIVLTSDLILSAGYHYHHLSNGFRGRINPGIDAHLLRLGVALSR